MPDENHLWVSWDAYHQAIERLALEVHKSGWKFDLILSLARGGLRPGDVFSRIFKLPLAVLSASSYREQAGTVQGELNISHHISLTGAQLAGKILIVDDLVDSGVTLREVMRHVSQRYPSVTEMKSAVIWYKACSVIRPDFYLDYLENNPWIHQPFELYDNLRPEQLAERLSGST